MQSTLDIPNPLLTADFDSALLPLCDGAPAPSLESEERIEQRMAQFAAVYYYMNQAVARIDAAQKAGDKALERQALERLREASQLRDALENECAPEGFYSEPEMEGKRYADLYFMWAGKSATPQVAVQRFEAEFTFQ